VNNQKVEWGVLIIGISAAIWAACLLLSAGRSIFKGNVFDIGNDYESFPDGFICKKENPIQFTIGVLSRLFFSAILLGIAFIQFKSQWGSHWVVTPNLLELDELLLVGLPMLGLGILIYVLIIRLDTADRKKLESGSAEEDEPVVLTSAEAKRLLLRGCFKIIIYIILIFAALIAFLVWYDNQPAG